jgi:pilus assembly protein Flp/PilA
MSKLLTGKVKKMLTGKKGQGMVEYGLIISLIAIAVIGALVVLGPKISDLFTTVSGKF